MNLHKKTFLFIVIIFIVIGVAVLMLFSPKSKYPDEQVSPVPSMRVEATPATPAGLSADFEKVVIKRVTEQEIVATIGAPAQKISEKGYTVLVYPIPPTRRQNYIYLQKNRAVLTVEEVTIDNQLYADFVRTSGTKEDGILYDKENSAAGFNWYIFSHNGIAFLANPTQGYTIRVLRFQPMEYQEFTTIILPLFSFSTSPPNIR